MAVRIEVVCRPLERLPSGDRLAVLVKVVHLIFDLAPARHKQAVFIKIPVESVYVVPTRHGAAVRPQIARHAVRHPLVLHESVRTRVVPTSVLIDPSGDCLTAFRQKNTVDALIGCHSAVRVEVIFHTVDRLPSGKRLAVDVQIIRRTVDHLPSGGQNSTGQKIAVEAVNVVPPLNRVARRIIASRHTVISGVPSCK